MVTVSADDGLLQESAPIRSIVELRQAVLKVDSHYTDSGRCRPD